MKELKTLDLNGTTYDSFRDQVARNNVPRIGENGNWWIGDTDTGVSAGGSGGGSEWKYYREQEVATDDEVSVIEFDNLLQYDEALLFVYSPWNTVGNCTAITTINGVQVEADWYNFQYANHALYNTLHIKRIRENIYDVSGYSSHERTKTSTRLSGAMKVKGIYDATASGGITKIGFTLNVALTANNQGHKPIIRYYAR